jgi:hypothetical protein
MTHTLAMRMAAAVLLAGLACGCDRFGMGNKVAEPDGAPSEQELQKISYMSSSDVKDQGRKRYSHYEEAKTCGDFELAMRWNRPPNVAGGAFHQKMVYLTSAVPGDLPKDAEVFVAGTIEKANNLTSGALGWQVRLRDGTQVLAVETQNFLEKQQQLAQDGKWVALQKPDTAGRAFCGQGVYQGMGGKDSNDPQQQIPLISILFGMDRDT